MSKILNKLDALRITTSAGVLELLQHCNTHLEHVKKRLEVRLLHHKVQTHSPAPQCSDVLQKITPGHTSLSSSHCQQLFQLSIWGANENAIKRNTGTGLGMVVHACNSSYSGGGDWENGGSWPVWAKSLRDPHLNQ
jgi:hypothetical protein